MPVVVDGEGKRLAKRTGGLTLDALFSAGVRPERILGLLAFWGGWAESGEELTVDEILPRFRIETLKQRSPVLDERALKFLFP